MISQFDGYEQLAEFDWDSYRSRYDDIGRLDLILTAQLQARAVPPIQVCVDDKTTTMHAGHTYRFTLGTSGSALR